MRGAYQPDFGQGLVIAEDEEAGLALLGWKHRKEQRSSAVPLECQGALEFLGAIGTQAEGSQTRMTRGQRVASERGMIYSRGAGLLG